MLICLFGGLQYALYTRGHSIKKYVDKMRGKGSKMSAFVHAQGKVIYTKYSKH